MAHLRAALLNSGFAIILRVITFVLNAFILRHISGEVLGVINVRLLLLVDTIIFISREAFRKACLKKPSNGDWRGTINLVWMSVPIGIASSLIFGYIWIYYFDQPSPDFIDQYVQAVILVSLSAIVELSFEPFFVIGQIFMWVDFRAMVDFTALLIRAVLLTLAVMWDPSRTILLFGMAHLFSSVIQWIAYFTKICYELKSEDSKLAPLVSLHQILPNISDTHVDQERKALAISFWKQGILKQLLTEGEKYVFTWFSLMTLEEQGIYDVVANLGALVARLVFSKVEESAYVYFNQSISRGNKVDPKVIKNLVLMLRTMSLFGYVVLAFGFSYSHLLLHLYGGSKLSNGLGHSLLRGHCFLVFLMAVNGVTECYSFAVMTRNEVDSYNGKLTIMAIIFLVFAWLLSHFFGPLGFIMANGFNFAMRIGHNVFVIKEKHGDGTLDGAKIPRQSALALILAFLIGQASELLIYDASNLILAIAHLTVGGFCFLICTLVTIYNEPHILGYLKSRLKKE